MARRIGSMSVDTEFWKLARQFKPLVERLQDPRPALEILADQVRKAYSRQYRSGTGWAPLKASTVRAKGSNKKLVDSGRMRNALTRKNGGGSTLDFSRYGLELRLVDRQLPQAKYLKSGARGMPPRDPGQLDRERLLRDSREVLLAHILQGSVR